MDLNKFNLFKDVYKNVLLDRNITIKCDMGIITIEKAKKNKITIYSKKLDDVNENWLLDIIYNKNNRSKNTNIVIK